MKLKSTLFAAVLSASLAMPAFANEEIEASQLPQFTAADTLMLFEQDAKPMQLAALSQQEMKETEGAWINFAVGAAGGLGFYAWHHRNNFSNMTWSGAAFSAGTGALTGGVGGILIRASGGGLAGNIAWRPNMMAINFGVGQIINKPRSIR